jgi:hypothetical protein
MALDPDKIRSGRDGPPLDHRGGGALPDDNLRASDIDADAYIGGGGERRQAGGDSCE